MSAKDRRPTGMSVVSKLNQTMKVTPAPDHPITDQVIASMLRLEAKQSDFCFLKHDLEELVNLYSVELEIIARSV